MLQQRKKMKKLNKSRNYFTLEETLKELLRSLRNVRFKAEFVNEASAVLQYFTPFNMRFSILFIFLYNINMILDSDLLVNSPFCLGT